MKMQVNGQEVDASLYSVSYPNDMLDGILIDLPESYGFLSDHVAHHRELMTDFDDEVEHFDLSDADVDYTKPPHKWVVDSVVKLVIRSAEQLIEG